MDTRIVECSALELKPPKAKELEYDEVIGLEPEPEIPASKTGPRPKKLVAVEVLGYEVGRGLRRRVVTPEDVFKLAALGCTDREIATWFDIKEDTLRYNFADIMAKGRQEMKTQLRHAMFKNALNGNAALQIFLAKNMLGMSDNPGSQGTDEPLPWREE